MVFSGGYHNALLVWLSRLCREGESRGAYKFKLAKEANDLSNLHDRRYQGSCFDGSPHIHRRRK